MTNQLRPLLTRGLGRRHGGPLDTEETYYLAKRVYRHIERRMQTSIRLPLLNWLKEQTT